MFWKCSSKVWENKIEEERKNHNEVIKKKETEITTLKSRTRLFDIMSFLLGEKLSICDVVKKEFNWIVVARWDDFENKGVKTMNFEIYDTQQMQRVRRKVASLSARLHYDDTYHFVSHAFIIDIKVDQCLQSQGYGTILMRTFIEQVFRYPSLEKITGQLVQRDMRTPALQKRLHHFYQKFGFDIQDIEGSEEKRITLKRAQIKQ